MEFIYNLYIYKFIYNLYLNLHKIVGIPRSSVVKNPPANAGNVGSIFGSGRPPEKGMATQSSILAWKITWTEEPGRLQSTGLQRVRHK